MIASCRFDAAQAVELAPGVMFQRWLHIDVPPGVEGSVGGLRLAPAAAMPTLCHSAAERVLYVLDGEAVLASGSRERCLRSGHLIFASAGAPVALHAASSGATLIDVLAGRLSGHAPSGEGFKPEVAQDGVLHVADHDDDRRVHVHRPEDGFHFMEAEFLVSEEICGARHLIIGRNRFDPRQGMHGLHRHAHAAEFLYPLSGAGVHLSPGTEIPLGLGQIDLVERNVWHGHANHGPIPFTGFFGFIGAGKRSAIGYELWDSHAQSRQTT